MLARARLTRADALRWAPLATGAAVALACLAVQPPVADLWAARARELAAGDGAVWGYWFSWYSGAATPAAYSVITPYVSTLIGSVGLLVLATVVTVFLCQRAVRHSRRPTAATWVAALACSADCWSGRVPFAVGTAFAAGVVLAVVHRRWWLAAPLAVVATLASPVVGALLIVALVGVLVCVPGYRTAAASAMSAAAVSAGTLGLLFGSPGVEPFDIRHGWYQIVGLLLLLLARPPRFVVASIALSALVYVVLLVHPNALGTNFNRMVWFWLPVAVVATAHAQAPRVIVAVAVALALGLHQTAEDLQVAASPVSGAGQYAALTHELSTLPDTRAYRVEAIADGTHAAAYELLRHARLAGGFETQLDTSRNAVLRKDDLTASEYERWMLMNSVALVVLHRTSLKSSPEARLVRHGLPYLQRVWSNDNWIVFRFDHAQPIVSAPARLAAVSQSTMTVCVRGPRRAAGGQAVRVRTAWSPFLSVRGPHGSSSSLSRDIDDTVALHTDAPGCYVLSG